MYMLKCLVSLKNCVVREVVCNPNSTIPMSFASKESAIKYAEVHVLNKPLANISNSNKVERLVSNLYLITQILNLN